MNKESNDAWAYESAVAGGICCVLGWFIFGGLCAILAIIFGANATKSTKSNVKLLGILEVAVGIIMALIMLVSLAV